MTLQEYMNRFANTRHRRHRIFTEKGVACFQCGLVATHAARVKDNGGATHVDLFIVMNHASFPPSAWRQNGTRGWRMMTIDHQLPRSKGGSNRAHNLVPMCEYCNRKKADKILT